MSLLHIDPPGVASRSGTNLRRGGRDVSKRIVDILLASAMIAIAAPVLAGIILLLAGTGGPVFRSEARVGKAGGIFRCLKFAAGETPVGRMLRQTALDELPQLFNVLRGDMSLVGPQPVTFEAFRTLYTGEAAPAYLSVRPGMTGPWQVNMRPACDARRVELDCLYAREHGLVGDMRLLLRTVALLATQSA